MTMNPQATPKFSVLGVENATSPSAASMAHNNTHQKKKLFLHETSRGSAMDMAERLVEISLRYNNGVRDTLMDSQHSLVPFLGDIDSVVVSSNNEKHDRTNANNNEMEDSSSKKLQRLIQLWSNETLSSLPLEHGIFEQDEAFWKAFVSGLPSTFSAWASVNALYQIERRFPDIAIQHTRLQMHAMPSEGTRMLTNEATVPIRTTVTSSTQSTSPQQDVCHEHDSIKQADVPKDEIAPNGITKSPLQEISIERALAEQWMDDTLCSLPIQDISELNMGIFMDCLSPARLSIDRVTAMKGLYGLERVETHRYHALLRQVQRYSAMATSSKVTANVETTDPPTASVGEVTALPLKTTTTSIVEAVVEESVKKPLAEPVVEKVPVGREPIVKESAVEKPLDESVDTPRRDPADETNHAIERALAVLWMDPNLRSLPIQDTTSLDMGVFLDALSAAKLSSQTLQAMNGLYGLERIEPSRFGVLLRSVQQHSSMAMYTSSQKVLPASNEPVSEVLDGQAITENDHQQAQTIGENTPTESVENEADILSNPVDGSTSPVDEIECSTLEQSALKEIQPEINRSEDKLQDSPAQDIASYATSETAMSSIMDIRNNDSAIPTSSTSSLKSTDSAIDIVPLKVAGNPSVTAPSYSEIIRKAASSEQVAFQELKPKATTNAQVRSAAPVKKSQPKSKFVPSLSAVVSVDDSKPIASPKDQQLFDSSSVVVLMTSNPAHPEIGRHQTIVENTLKEEGCNNYLLIDGADRVQKWKRNSLFELSGSHGEYPQIFHRDSSGKLSFWGTFEAFMKAKKRGSLLDELMNRSNTPIVDEAEKKTLLVLVSMQSLKQEVKVKQAKAFSILDAHGITYETLDGADSVNKDRRTQLFAISGNPGNYPQFFSIGPDQEVSHWGDWDDFESANELGSFVKEFGATKAESVVTNEHASQVSGPAVDGSLVCLISGQSIERKVRTQQEKSFAIFNDRSIEYKVIDGAEKANKTLRKKLFGISGLNAVYPQFFLKKNDMYVYLGGWEKLEECNDTDNMALFLTPVPNERKASDTDRQAKSNSSSVNRSLSTQSTPKMENLSHDDNNVVTKTKIRTETAKSSAPKSEITFYGATSFVAKHALDYMIQVSLTLPGVRSITLAGRNAEKLERLRKTVTDKMANMRTIHPNATGRCSFNVFVADSCDAAGLETMASSTKVVASFAGPFAKYSEQVVAACAKVGTDYVDITGEVSWASAMRLKYSSLAEESKARIISFCGFDSIPSDLAIYAAAENMKRKLGRSTEIVSGTTWHYSQGSVNGGTIHTVVDMPLNIFKCFSRWVPFLVDDPLSLSHPKVRLDPDYSKRKNQLAVTEWMNQLPMIEGFLGNGVSAPFVMAPVNAKVVHASAIALNYGTNFVYRERFLPLGFRMTKSMSILSLIPALVVQFGVFLLGLVLKLPIIGKVLSQIFLPPGSGMSDQMCQKGLSEVYAEVVSAETNGKVDRVYCAMKFEGDPGNWVTAQCVCESALSLVLDRAKLPKRSVDGFGTPAELLGSVLLERLEKTKVRPVDVKTYVQKNSAPGERVLCHFE